MESETMNFVGKEAWHWPLPDEDFLNFRKEPIPNDIKIVVLRSLLFFYSGQQVTVGDLRNFFTEKSITALLHDNFVEIIKIKK